jgi:hypothetical protein
MKLYAQHGFGNGNKIERGLEDNLVDGLVFSPRDISIDRLGTTLDQILSKSKCDILFDPQLYACFLAKTTEARLGCLLDDDYKDYFQVYRRSTLEREQEVAKAIRLTLEFQKNFPFTAFIAPNILIPSSFNSIEAVIAKNFIRMTADEHSRLNDRRPVYATLAISREALLDKQELTEFLNEITVLENGPDGFYLLISARSADAKTDIYNTDVIAGIMLINHSLKINGFKVINGYSDILTPFVGAVGAEAGCSGWWSNLRAFSLDRFAPSEGGGRQPILRYLSMALLNRITYYELDQLRNIIPEIVNHIPSDKYYSEENGSEPEDRTIETLQSWDAIKGLNSKIAAKNTEQSLINSLNLINNANKLYDQITIQLDRKSSREHLDALRDGIFTFAERAEIKLSGK